MPITHALFAEHSDITDIILKTKDVGFYDLVNNPKAAAVLKSFIVSMDFPSVILHYAVANLNLTPDYRRPNHKTYSSEPCC